VRINLSYFWKRKNILVIANYYSEKKKNIGGATILCSSFKDYLRANRNCFKFLEVRFFDCEILNYLYLILIPFVTLNYSKVILVVSVNGFRFLYPYFALVYKFFGVKLILRVLGGNADIIYANLLFKFPVRLALKMSDFVFFETKFLCNFFINLGNVRWFPNSRNFNDLTFKPRFFTNRFVYLGRISSDKGIDLLLEVFETKLNGYHLEIYGPVEKDYVPPIYFNKYYMGLLPNNLVPDKLETFDFLILPTKFPGEGYPGIIIEAFAASLPVITTKWRSIPEIVINNKNGFLMESFHVDDLVKIILSLKFHDYDYLRRCAFHCHSDFTDSFVIEEYFLKVINI
jgi:glycosyltransferase involved in cell wall biosynthesis